MICIKIPSERREIRKIDTALYLTTGETGIYRFEVGDSPALRQTDGYQPPGEAWDVATWGDYLYVASGEQGIWVGKRLPDGSFSTVNKVQTAGAARSISQASLNGSSYLIVAAGRGLEIIDIDQPERPTSVAFSEFYGRLGAVLELTMQNRSVYVAASNGVGIVDVSTPVNPQLTSLHELPTPALTLVNWQSMLYVVDAEGLVRQLQRIE